MSEHSSIRTLTCCPLFDSMTPDELDVVFRLMKTEHFPAGGEILTEGLVYQSLWIVIDGRCEVVKGAAGAHPNRLAVVESGGVFGEMSFLETAPHSASIRSLSDVDTMRLTRAGYDQLTLECPAAADKIARSLIIILARRLRRMDEWTCGLVQTSNNERHHAEWQDFRAKLYAGLQF